MAVGEAIEALAAGERPTSFEQFSAAIDPQWIAEALAATDTASVRRRKLPAEHVVWLVIGMGLFRDRSIAQVVHHLDLVVRSASGGRRRVTNAAIVQARDQLGAAPLAALFTQTAQAWALPAAAADRWRGLAVYGLDGTTLRIADTAENVAEFGRPPSPHGGGAGYPQLRLVTLLALRAHLLTAAAFGPSRTSELALATDVWAALPEHALVLLDRNFCSYALFHRLATPERDRHWIIRSRSGPHELTQVVLQRFGPGDALIELRPGKTSRAKYPDLPPVLAVRAVRVQRRGFRPYWVFTSLRNPATHPAAELAALYHERWELELAFDELKTHTCDRVEALRSKAPTRVAQELWGLLLAYNLVRLVMSRAAPRAGVPPLRLSYRYALLAVRAFWYAAWDTSPATLPRRLEALLDELALFVLPERRPRRYPRAVKLKMSGYLRNRPDRRTSRAK
jgi:hypothetical protein